MTNHNADYKPGQVWWEKTNLKAGGMPGQVWRDPQNELIMYGRPTAHADRRQYIQACKEKVFFYNLHFLFYAHDD
jgi:hypothetical protein